MKIKSSHRKGLYDIVKEANLVPEIAKETGFSGTYIRQMFLGLRGMSNEVWHVATRLADQYLESQEAAGKKADETIRKYQTLKSNNL